MTTVATTSMLSATGQISGNSIGTNQYLTFVLSGAVYALNILHSKEIINYGSLTEVPMMPTFVCGIINLRGRVVPVIDLVARFEKGATQIAKRSCIVVLETHDEGEPDNRQDIGIIVDAVNEVIEINQQDIEPSPSFGTGIRQDFISGMAKRNDRFIIILNVNHVLSVDEMTNLSKVTAGQLTHGNH